MPAAPIEPPVVTCPLCGSSGAKEVTERWDGGFFCRCGVCGGEFTPVRAGKAEYYEESYGAAAAEYSDDKWEFRQFFADAAALGFPKTVLDVGCGSGFFLRAAASRGFSVWGIDFNEPAVSHAKSLGFGDRVAVVPVDGVARVFPGIEFGATILFHVLEHLDDPAGTLRLIRERLGPGGILVVAVPNARRAAIRARFGRRREGWDYPPHHLTRWNAESLVRFLRAEGLEIVNVVEERVRSPQQTFSLILGALQLLTATGLGRRAVTGVSSVGTAPAVTVRGTVWRTLSLAKQLAVSVIAVVAFAPVFLLAQLVHLRGTNLYAVARVGRGSPERDRLVE